MSPDTSTSVFRALWMADWVCTAKENSRFSVRIEKIRNDNREFVDEITYERLIKILSLYRLTLGQARQEELLEYLFKNCDDPDKLKELFINLSPFYKMRNMKVKAKVINQIFMQLKKI